MVTRTRLKKSLKETLERIDPNQLEYPEIKRARINYPMKNFNHMLKEVVTECPQLMDVNYLFDDESISKGITTCVFKAADRMIKLSYDYHDDSVVCFCIGKSIDGTKKTVNVNELVEAVKEYFPVVKRKIVIKKKIS